MHAQREYTPNVERREYTFFLLISSVSRLVDKTRYAEGERVARGNKEPLRERLARLFVSLARRERGQREGSLNRENPLSRVSLTHVCAPLCVLFRGCSRRSEGGAPYTSADDFDPRKDGAPAFFVDYDAPIRLSDDQLPLRLPEMDDFAHSTALFPLSLLVSFSF